VALQKIVLLVFFLVFLLGISSASWAWRCSQNCGQIGIFSGRYECMAWKSVRMDTFKGYVQAINRTCSVGSLGGRGALPKAKDILIRMGFYSNSDFNGVKIKWCSLVDWGAAGMVTGPNTIILGRDYRHKNAETLVPLLGHEMVHVKQIRKMGFDRWACEYGNQILKGNKWTEKNFLEKEAYDYERKIEKTPIPRRSCTYSYTKDTLSPGQSLSPDERLASRNGCYVLLLQQDGNLVLYKKGKALWATGTNTINSQRKPTTAIMQGDGNLVLYARGGVPIWDSGTWGNNRTRPQNRGSRLILQNDGNLVIYRPDGKAIWALNDKGWYSNW